MSRVISPVTGKPYGLATVCRVWRLARSGVYRHLCALVTPAAAQRRGPLGAMSDAALTTAIQGVKFPRIGGRFRGWRTVGLFASPVRSKWASDTPGRSAVG